MRISEHYLQVKIERLEAALTGAITYLRLLPKVPVTTRKISELEEALNPEDNFQEFETNRQWGVERLTPAGQPIRINFNDGELRFEAGVEVPANTPVSYKLSREQLDSLIDALIVWRRNPLGEPKSNGTKT